MLWLEHPAWLWPGLALVVAVAVVTFRLRRRSWRWRLAGLLLPAVSALSVALALAGTTAVRHPPVILLLDFSPSTSRSPWRDPAWVQAQARRHLADGQRISVVAFSGKQKHLLLAGVTPNGVWPTLWDWDPPDPPPGQETRLDDALDSGTRTNGARWVMTDGLYGTLPPDPAIAWTLLAPGAPDAAIRDLQLRPAGPGKIQVLVQLRVTGLSQPTAARVVVTRDGQLITDQSVEFRPAAATPGVERWLTVTDDAPPEQPHHYAATIALPGDAWPRNDRGTATWPAAAARRTLIVSATPITLPGVMTGTAQFNPTASQLAAEGWQVIVLHNIPTASDDPAHPPLAPAAAQALDRFVREDGGGLVLLADGPPAHAFGPGRYGEGTPAGDLLEALAPVASHPPQKSLAVMFLLDASSSMNDVTPGTGERKITLLSRAVQNAASYLAPQDSLTVATFNGTASVLAQGDAAEFAPRLADLLASIHPSGPTNPDAALPAVRFFTQSDAPSDAPRLIIFVTDGDIPSLNLPAWKAALQAPATHLAIIAPPTAATAPLAALARLPQTTWSQTDHPQDWPAALRESILAQTRGTLQSTSLPWEAADLTATAPRWIRTWHKPESTDLATAPAAPDVPVAALAQRGLGKVAALTISGDHSPAYQTLCARLVQAVTAEPGDRRFTVSAHRALDGRWAIAADASDAGKFLDGEHLQAQALDDPSPVPMTQTAPGHYQALLPAAPDGLAAVIQRPGPPPQLVARVQAPGVETTEWPATVDPAPLPPGITVLAPDDSRRWQPQEATSLAPWLWGLAALAALAALWVRQT